MSRHWLFDDRSPLGNGSAAAATIELHLRPDRLRVDHPITQLWHATGDRARKALYHLADDLGVVASATGAASLFEALRSDAAQFDSYRYELRMAGAIGRAPNQRIVRVGGKDFGPDVEFVSRFRSRVRSRVLESVLDN